MNEIKNQLHGLGGSTLHRLIATCIIAALPLNWAFAEQGVLLDDAVLNESSPQNVLLNSDGDYISSGFSATYASTGGWTVTGAEFIDAVVMSFDMGATASVSQATLTLPVEEVFAQDGSAFLWVYAYADNGFIDLSDFSQGSSIAVIRIDAALSVGNLQIDVTGATNAILATSQYVGFRIVSTVAPADVADQIPKWTGVRFGSQYSLEFTSGAAPVPMPGQPSFDGFKLTVPNLRAAGVGVFDIELSLTELNADIFVLSGATTVSLEDSSSSFGLSGVDLLNCSAFNPPAPPVEEDENQSTYSIVSGLLDIRSVFYNGDELAMQMQLMPDTNPMQFQLLSVNKVVPIDPDVAPEILGITQFGGSTTTEPSQDFVPLCHGWILLGDSANNRIVERNVISGETAGVYQLNSIPDQLLLDEDNGILYITLHPETKHIIRLDLNDGTQRRLDIVDENLLPPLEIGLIARKITLGPEGVLIAIFNRPDDPDGPEGDLEADQLSLGFIDSNTGMVLRNDLDLDTAVRVEFDEQRNRIFLTTASNLGTLTFDPDTLATSILPNTDIPVGSGCTDFSVSPDGTRLAYSCPAGNEQTSHLSIVDFSPIDYFDIAGEWYLGATPVSATFNDAGTLLIALSTEKLQIFDVVTHLLLEEYNLDIVGGEFIKRVRLTRDGDHILFFTANALNDASGKTYWMVMPSVTIPDPPL